MDRRVAHDRPVRMYPRRADINRAVQAARANGIPVGTIECAPDGTIRVTADKPKAEGPKSAFDLWNEAGKL